MLVAVSASLENQLARFLKERRGDLTYAEFSRKLGFPPSTLHRLEQGSQSITLRGLQQILRKLKCGLADVFPEDFGH
jgi:transcriptional regulator with XRE-family HTH domain